MLFLVISSPSISRPQDMKSARQEFRNWIKELQAKNKVICFYPKVGRGSIVIFDVSSNDELHLQMTQWLDIVPVSFEIHPLVNPSEAEKLLQ
jgi:hypothetical protein